MAGEVLEDRCGSAERVLVAQDIGGIRVLLIPYLARGHSPHQRWPRVERVDIAPTSMVETVSRRT